ncbi:MAG: hypothetical protein ACRC2T_04570 [Thermoguttaceae bacterium]
MKNNHFVITPRQYYGFVAVCCFSIFFVSGCKKNNFVKISGKVTVAGEPVDSGSIAFAPADGKTSIEGAEIKNGTYEAKVPPGDKIVMIRGLRLEPSEVFDQVSGITHKSETAIRITDPKYEAEKSPLKATVKKNGEVHDFEIKD